MFHVDRDYVAENGETTRVGYSEGEERVPVIALVAGITPASLPTHDESGNELPKVRFRLLDDDNEVYYGGWLHDDEECFNQLAALRFGEWDAGACIVQVKRNDEWITEIG